MTKRFDDLDTAEDLDDVFGPVKQIEAGPGLSLVRDDDEEPILPSETPKQLARQQTVAAVQRVHEDASKFPRFPVLSLDRLAGSLAPGELWVIGGRPGNGKSLFVHNLLAWLIDQQVPAVILGTEQEPYELRIKQACVHAGVKPRLILKPEKSEIGTTAYELAQKDVQKSLWWLEAEPQCRYVAWANDEYIDRSSLIRWTQWGREMIGARVVIVDHLHHMRHSGGRSAWEELSETVHLAKDLAKGEGITVIAISQLRRATEAIQVYTPPALEDFAGAAAIERTANVALGLWRPLRTDLPIEDLRKLQQQAKLGHAADDRVYQPDVMAVRLLKDRLGDAPGRQTMVSVRAQRLEEIPERDQFVTAFGTAGPRP